MPETQANDWTKAKVAGVEAVRDMIRKGLFLPLVGLLIFLEEILEHRVSSGLIAFAVFAAGGLAQRLRYRN